jgi:hypothetical protein
MKRRIFSLFLLIAGSSIVSITLISFSNSGDKQAKKNANAKVCVREVKCVGGVD